jgi:triphosphoribosyl-dephospho-CoA synthetase
MSMNKTVAQLRISRELIEAEHALNEALLRQSNLFSTMLVARRDTQVGSVLGQDALMRLAKAQQTLLSAGGDLARVHSRLREIGESFDLIRAGDDCPEREPLSAPMGAFDGLREAA